ncbi:hypothetical protein [Schaalia vaccimaxillae]|uniref:hypothetical protein n=1 Tax=Schaalia vaccimaxillae TaxID=183916 RepID=UPI0003B5706D|nr:hypothetical protein [Schaalia vaccimaxillae]
MTYFNQAIVAAGAEDLLDLRSDMGKALTYGDTYLGDLGRRSGGFIFSRMLSEHEVSVAKFESLVHSSRRLLGNAKDHLDDTIDAYVTAEAGNVDEIIRMWSALEADPGSQPLGPAPAGSPTSGRLPSEVLTPPDGTTDHWIWNVLSWPDYLSFGTWIRKIISWVGELFGIDDLWMWLWEWLGGDFNKIADVGDAWEKLGDCFSELSSELSTRMQVMFTGWNDSDDATAAGLYFTKAVEVLGSCENPLSQLGDLYRYIAFSSFGFFQAIYSAVDAAIDAAIAALLGFGSIAEAIAALFTGGATAIAAVISAFASIVAQMSSFWGWMMTAVYAIVGLASLLGVATTDVEWVVLPEG